MVDGVSLKGDQDGILGNFDISVWLCSQFFRAVDYTAVLILVPYG
jgi:hypothetical protein